MKRTTMLVAGSLLLAAASAFAQGVNDAQIASIVVTANQVDIDAAKVAKSTSSNAEVKKFARADGHRPHRREQVGGGVW